MLCVTVAMARGPRHRTHKRYVSLTKLAKLNTGRSRRHTHREAPRFPSSRSLHLGCLVKTNLLASCNVPCASYPAPPRPPPTSPSLPGREPWRAARSAEDTLPG